MTPPTDPSYTAQALRTESPITPALQTRLQQQARLVHAVLGLQTEAGELADPVKKHIYYGRSLDPVNLREEIGDCLWYLAIACDALGTTLEAEQARNLAKLRARYPHVFTAEAAQVRDLDRERQVLEGNDLGTLVQQSQRAVSDAFSEVNSLRQQLAAAQAEVETLRKQLTEAQQERVDAIDDYKVQIAAAEALIDPEANGETTIAAMADMILHLRRQLYAGTEPTTVAEPAPCPERELSEEMQDAVPPTCAPLVWDLRRRLREAQQELGRELLDAEARGHKLERLRRVVDKVRQMLFKPNRDIEYGDINGLRAALAEFDANSSAILTSSAVKESLSTEPEGVK